MAHKKPPLGAMVGQFSAVVGSVTKKTKKSHLKNINTISHDEEKNNPNLLRYNVG